jgi:O-antigen ligase
VTEIKPVIKTVWTAALDAEPLDLPSVRILDFVAFAILPLEMIVIEPLGPANELSMLVLAAACFLRRPIKALKTPVWLAGLLVMLVGYLAINSLLLGDVNVKRTGHLVVWALIIIFLASGHIDIMSAAKGLSVSMTFSVLHALATIGQSAYPGRLTGLLGDPNTAALSILVLGSLGVFGITKRRWRYAYVALMTAGLFECQSRTALLALIAVLAWMIVGRRVGWVGGYALLVFGAIAIGSIPPETSLFGPFEGRSGSDALRARINELSSRLVAEAPWRGHGLGTATVLVGSLTFFFHNSYMALICEAGIPGLILYGIVVFVFVTSLVSRPRAYRNPWIEVAIVAALICALNLGEALLLQSMATALGFAMRTNLKIVAEHGDVRGTFL